MSDNFLVVTIDLLEPTVRVTEYPLAYLPAHLDGMAGLISDVREALVGGRGYNDTIDPDYPVFYLPGNAKVLANEQ